MFSSSPPALSSPSLEDSLKLSSADLFGPLTSASCLVSFCNQPPPLLSPTYLPSSPTSSSPSLVRTTPCSLPPTPSTVAGTPPAASFPPSSSPPLEPISPPSFSRIICSSSTPATPSSHPPLSTPDLVRRQLYKTKQCPHHRVGQCQKGWECSFAHSADEVRPLPDLRNTRLCGALRAGSICRDHSCCFAHSRAELRTTDVGLYKVRLCNFNKKGKCLNREHCRFAHGNAELRVATKTPSCLSSASTTRHSTSVSSGAPTTSPRSPLSFPPTSTPPTTSHPLLSCPPPPSSPFSDVSALPHLLSLMRIDSSPVLSDNNEGPPYTSCDATLLLSDAACNTAFPCNMYTTPTTSNMYTTTDYSITTGTKLQAADNQCRRSSAVAVASALPLCADQLCGDLHIPPHLPFTSSDVHTPLSSDILLTNENNCFPPTASSHTFFDFSLTCHKYPPPPLTSCDMSPSSSSHQHLTNLPLSPTCSSPSPPHHLTSPSSTSPLNSSHFLPSHLYSSSPPRSTAALSPAQLCAPSSLFAPSSPYTAAAPTLLNKTTSFLVDSTAEPPPQHLQQPQLQQQLQQLQQKQQLQPQQPQQPQRAHH
eukprot:GHVS01021892.1.p1 GENE.GHVS01021892.1~~GHVS01021892.1.p1  ORF type:complete len:631 (-),score=194.21 GHVS01021892.1:17-1792(-)